MTGKLGQSLRKYNEQQGQPDFELEKFAINSLLSASHTAEMDSNDQEDIIKKVKEAGNDGKEDDNSDDSTDSNDGSSDGDNVSDDFGGDMGAPDQGGTETSGEINEEDSIFLDEPKKNNMFQPGSNDILDKDLKESKKSSIIDKSKIKSKLQETFNQDDKEMSEPMTEPAVKPAPVKTPKKQPSIAPSRKNKPFLPMPEVQPDPKATK